MCVLDVLQCGLKDVVEETVGEAHQAHDDWLLLKSGPISERPASHNATLPC